jgi:hypothetical protein
MWREDKERQLRTAVLVIFFCGLAGLGNIVVGWLGWETSIKKNTTPVGVCGRTADVVLKRRCDHHD